MAGFASPRGLQWIGAAIGALLIAGCSLSTTGGEDDAGLETVHLSAVGTPHQDLADLVADSSLVVVGSVSGAGPSTTIESGGEDIFEIVALRVAIDDVLSPADATLDEVVIPWEAFKLDDDRDREKAVVINGIETPRIGEKYVFFLEALTEEEKKAFGATTTHELVGLDGIYTVHGDRIASDSNSRSPAISDVTAKSLAELREEIPVE